MGRERSVFLLLAVEERRGHHNAYRHTVAAFSSELFLALYAWIRQLH